MKIAFYGSSLVSAYWNGAATYYRGIIRNLAALGHQVTFFEPDAYQRQQHRDLKEDPEWARVVVYRGDTLHPASGHPLPASRGEGREILLPSARGEGAPQRTNGSDEGFTVEQALDQAKHFDVVVKASGVGVFDELLEQAVVDQRRAHQILIFWDVDAPATLDRMQHDPADPFRPLVPRYDFVFTYGGGDPVVRRYRALGARECIPIYNALDPLTHHPVAPDRRFEADLSFLGNRLPDREARVDEFFFRAAAMLPQRKLLLGGSGWDDKPMPPSVRYAGHVFTSDHNAFNCTPRAVLNISRDSMASNGWSPATRVFEAAGAGACLITDAWEGIEMFLEPGREVLVAHDGADVAEIVESLDACRARCIGQAALRRVLAEHTYAHRAAQVGVILSGSRPLRKVEDPSASAGLRMTLP